MVPVAPLPIPEDLSPNGWRAVVGIVLDGGFLCARAAAREFLIAQGVKGSRISSIAYGKERPAALCDAEQCWSQNRRAVTVITGGANQ